MTGASVHRQLPAVSTAPAVRALIVLILLCLSTASACTRSQRESGLKVAQLGTTTAGQLAQYYQTLQQDIVDTYELNVFREAFNRQRAYDAALRNFEIETQAALRERRPPPARPVAPSLALSDLDRELLAEYQRTYRALQARRQLAQAMRDAYGSFVNLTQYNATEEVQKNIGGLTQAATAASTFLLPDPTGTVNSVVEALFRDVARELATAAQNRSVVQASNQLAGALVKLQQIFDAERVLYGGDQEVTDGAGQKRQVSGIAGRRAAAYKSVAQELVETEAVISTVFLNRVLGQYDLRWPDPQVPFTQPAIKSGIIKLIEARSYPIVQMTTDTGAGLSRSLGQLASLHRQLAANRPLTLQEAAQNSATVEVLLEELSKRNTKVATLAEILQAIQQGAVQ
jgi:hypothetical protein